MLIFEILLLFDITNGLGHMAEHAGFIIRETNWDGTENNLMVQYDCYM